MALTGMHIACGYAGAPTATDKQLPLLSKPIWSQTMASAGVTTNAAPPTHALKGDPVFQVRASSDSYVAIASAPDASTGARIFIPAGVSETIYADPGDRLAWIAA